MTSPHLVDIGATSVVAGVTAAGVMVGADLSGWLVPVVSAGIAALVGYYTSRITSEREMGVMAEREGNHFTELLRRLERIERKLDAQE